MIYSNLYSVFELELAIGQTVYVKTHSSHINYVPADKKKYEIHGVLQSFGKVSIYDPHGDTPIHLYNQTEGLFVSNVNYITSIPFIDELRKTSYFEYLTTV